MGIGYAAYPRRDLSSACTWSRKWLATAELLDSSSPRYPAPLPAEICSYPNIWEYMSLQEKEKKRMRFKQVKREGDMTMLKRHIASDTEKGQIRRSFGGSCSKVPLRTKKGVALMGPCTLLLSKGLLEVHVRNPRLSLRGPPTQWNPGPAMVCILYPPLVTVFSTVLVS